jgi:hypothetical protein
MIMKHNRNNLWELSSVLAISALFMYLPLSAYMVSISGSQAWGFGRDICVLILAVATIFLVMRKNRNGFVENRLLWSVILLFLLWMTLSIFWKEGGVTQWMRGWRHNGLPYIYLILLCWAVWLVRYRKIILSSILIGSIIPLIIAGLQVLGVAVPLGGGGLTLGGLQNVSFVGTLSIQRIPSLLAGPNAFGLYLAFLFPALYWWVYLRKREWRIFFSISILLTFFLTTTFSRSAWLAGGIVLLSILYLITQDTIGRSKAACIFGVPITLGILSLLFIPSLRNSNILNHNDSSNQRIQQYKRVWDERSEISWHGRGIGMAGLSSQNRLDNGPNNWTENTLLDIYEQLGWVGLLLYLGVWVTIGYILWMKSGQMRFISLAVLIAVFVASLTISLTTGEVGIFLAFYLLSLGLHQSS